MAMEPGEEVRPLPRPVKDKEKMGLSIVRSKKRNLYPSLGNFVIPSLLDQSRQAGQWVYHG
jgi:hypothetical protein